MRSHKNVSSAASSSSARLRAAGAAAIFVVLAVLATSQAAEPPASAAVKESDRISDPAYLHNALRKRTGNLIDMATAQGLTVYYYQTYLEPRDQHAQFLAHATTDDAWSSLWQYGMVTTILPYADNRWDMHPGDKVQQQIKSIALKAGLQQEGAAGDLAPFTFVVPGTSIADLRAGKYPEGGGKTWVQHLNAMLGAWGTQSPPAPPPAPPMPMPPASGR